MKSTDTYIVRRLACFEAEDRVQRAPADHSRSERDETDPAPDRLIGRPEKAESSGDEREADVDAQDPIESSDIRSHDVSLPLE